MKIATFLTRTVLFPMITGVALVISLAASPSPGAENMDADADRILKAMSSYLAKAEAFQFNADVDFEIVTNKGQKLQFSSLVTATIKRPEKLHITRKGMIVDLEYIYDGKVSTLYGKNLNAYSQTEGTGTIDDAIMAYEYETGLSAPGADLLLSDPYSILSSGVESSVYIGTAYVNGVECHHLAFREAKVDWQLWVKTGEQPLPMKYVITTKWVTGAPQYEIRLRDWNVNPKIEADQFSFSALGGAKKIDALPAGELDEITSVKEGEK